MDSKIEDVDLTKQKVQDRKSVSPTYTSSTGGNSAENSGNSSDSNSTDGQQAISPSSDEMSNKKSGDSGSNDSRSNDSRSNDSSGSEESGSSSNRSPRQSRRDRKPRRWTAEDEETDSTMPRPILVQKAHPKWDCKREGCRGKLALIGRLENHCPDVESAKRRAEEMRKLYPATYVHGSLLSCNMCGDRPKHGSRYATWQRLCQICGEPYAMNGFWRMHGGCNNKKMESALEYRAPLHKKKLRESKWSASTIAKLDNTLSAEKKYLILAHKKMLNGVTAEISDASIDKFEGTYETYAEDGYKENGRTKTTTTTSGSSSPPQDDAVSVISSTSSSHSGEFISLVGSNSPASISSTQTKTSDASHGKLLRARVKSVKRVSNVRRRVRNRVQLAPGEIPKTHPALSCKREGCAANVTLLGNVKSHFECLEECQKRAAVMAKEYPETFFHGSVLSCEECGDRPRVGKNGRHASWQRLCRICGEAYAMNGFWRSHGGYNNQNVRSPLHLRSSIHKSNLRKEWKADAIESLDACLDAEKAWLRLALTDTNFRLRGEIKDVDSLTSKVGRMSTSNVVSAAKRHRSVSDGALVVPHSSSMKRGNFVMNGKGKDASLGALSLLGSAAQSMNSTTTTTTTSASPRRSAVQPMMPMYSQPQVTLPPPSPQITLPPSPRRTVPSTTTTSWHARDFLPVLGHFVQIYTDGAWHRACIAKLEGGFVYFFLPNLAITKQIALPNDDLVLRPDFGFAISQQPSQQGFMTQHKQQL